MICNEISFVRLNTIFWSKHFGSAAFSYNSVPANFTIRFQHRKFRLLLESSTRRLGHIQNVFFMKLIFFWKPSLLQMLIGNILFLVHGSSFLKLFVFSFTVSLNDTILFAVHNFKEELNVGKVFHWEISYGLGFVDFAFLYFSILSGVLLLL